MEKMINNSEAGHVIEFPAGLTVSDLKLIRKQCEIQGATGKEQIRGFALAYLKAKELAADTENLANLSPEQAENLILELAALIEKRNEKGYRRVSVTFRNGAAALDAENIPQAMSGFCRGLTDFLADPVEDEQLNALLLYTEFEKIHPFEDGNGRVGDLLWKMMEADKTGKWPEALPPDVFSGKNNQ